MRPLRAAFGQGYDPEADLRSLSPVQEASGLQFTPNMSQENIGMKMHHQKELKAILVGANRGEGAITRKPRSISNVRDVRGFNNNTTEPINVTDGVKA